MMYSNQSILTTNKKLQLSAFATLLLLAMQPLSSQAVAQQAELEPVSTKIGVPTLSTEIDFKTQEAEYILGVGDRLNIDVFQEEDYSGEYIVLVDGTVSLPLAGKVTVEGITISEMTELLSQKYARYLRFPVVTVSLVAPRPLTIAISGEVSNPGAYTITLENSRQFPSVIDIIQQAGGLTAAADVRNVQVRRSYQGGTMNIDLWELLQQANLRDNVFLRDGDSIIVPTKDEIDVAETRQLADANFGIQANKPVNVAIVGEVYRPGSYTVEAERVVAQNGEDKDNPMGSSPSQPPKLTQAIQLAGGIKPLADIREIEVRRPTRSGNQQTIQVNLWQLLQEGNLNQDLILQEGDTIVIPTAENIAASEVNALATASFAPSTIQVNVVGEVKEPGTVELPPNTTLNQALLAAGGFDDQRAKKSAVELVRLNPNGTVTKREIKIDLAADINDQSNPTLRNNDVIVVERSGVTSFSDSLETILKPVGQIFSPLSIFRIFR